MAGCDSVDISLVDGWTLPFKLEVKSGTCTAAGEKTVSEIDCSALNIDQCPTDDNLGSGPVNLQAISPHTGKPAGCYAPCLKLLDDKWGNTMATGHRRDEPEIVPYCCTTPPMTSETCNAGPIAKTKYVQAVHNHCPGVYSFAYDDGMGLLRCSYGEYQVTFFCPGKPEDAPAPGGHAPMTAAPAAPDACSKAPEGADCCKAVQWARLHGIFEHPAWYANASLTSASSPADFQAELNRRGQAGCPPVGAAPPAANPVTPAPPAVPSQPAPSHVLQRFLELNLHWQGPALSAAVRASVAVSAIAALAATVSLLVRHRAWRQSLLGVCDRTPMIGASNGGLVSPHQEADCVPQE